METTDTTSRTDLLVTLGHRVVETATQAQDSLTDGMLIVTVTATTEHPYLVRRYDDQIVLRDDGRPVRFDPVWHLPAVIVFEPTHR